MKGFKMDMGNVALYVKDSDNDFARHTKKKLRQIFNASNLDVHDVWDIEDARQKLLQYKSHGMIAWDWKYQDDVRYLFRRISSNQHSQATVNLFNIIQQSYKTILNNDDTQDLEQLHLALVEAIHEWAFKYQFDAEPIKKENESVWKRVIAYIANKLVDEVDAYNSEYDKMFGLDERRRKAL